MTLDEQLLTVLLTYLGLFFSIPAIAAVYSKLRRRRLRREHWKEGM